MIMDRRQTTAKKFQGNGQGGNIASLIPKLIYVFQKDSKTVTIFEPSIPKVKNNKKLFNIKGNFPHNF